MLQSIQFIGSGPPTYVYASKATGASMEFYQVFAAETRSYEEHRERRELEVNQKKKMVEHKQEENHEMKVTTNQTIGNLQELYEREYGRRESFLWKQR